MRRCAIYARYSSDLQRESSIEDQVRRCCEYARQKGWEVVEAFVVADRALSAAAVAGRDGLERLLEAAQGKSRPFDCLLIEDTSRLARDLADARFLNSTVWPFAVGFRDAMTLLRSPHRESLLKDVVSFYQIQLHRHPEAAHYLQLRGIQQPQIVEELAIGYAGPLPGALMSST